jgi:hypothetical protein
MKARTYDERVRLLDELEERLSSRSDQLSRVP